MQFDQQVIAQNETDAVIVLSSDPKGSEQVEWKAKDDPNGEDVQVIPEVIAKSPAFAKLINKGIVTLLQAPEAYQEAIDKQRASFDARMKGAQAKAEASISEEAKNDMISVPCIGPDSRGAGQCGNLVPVREKVKDEQPPLCPSHVAMKAQFLVEEVQEPGSTTITKKWIRATLGARERQSA